MNKKTIGQGKFISLIIDPYITKDGKTINYEIASRNTVPGLSSAVATLLENITNKTYILVEQYRHPIKKNELGLIAGISDENIDTIETVGKEIKEEAGRVVRDSKFLTTVASSSGFTDEQIDLFHSTTDSEFIGQDLGEAEDIKIHEIPKENIEEYLLYAEKDLGLNIGTRIDTVLRHIRAGKGIKI